MNLAHELHGLVRTLDRWAEWRLRPEGLSYNRYIALVILDEHPGITGRMLAGALEVTEAAASGIVRALLDGGHVRNMAGRGSGNVRRLALTDSGRSTLARASALLEGSLDDSARRIGIDPESLAFTIRKLHDEVRHPPADTPEKEEHRP
ncbi:MAG: hypothetical protein Q4D79_12090 [Propionibacteriaceae bacterium]|nr:hypothetical protein [Propionibacteriaceae bacterium]